MGEWGGGGRRGGRRQGGRPRLGRLFGGGRRGGRRGRGPRGPPFICDDGEKANCECESPPCGPGNNPSCSCNDGSSPRIPAPCNDGSYPVCEEGSCQDGSVAVLSEDPFTNPRVVMAVVLGYTSANVEMALSSAAAAAVGDETKDAVISLANKMCSNWINLEI